MRLFLNCTLNAYFEYAIQTKALQQTCHNLYVPKPYPIPIWAFNLTPITTYRNTHHYHHQLCLVSIKSCAEMHIHYSVRTTIYTCKYNAAARNRSRRYQIVHFDATTPGSRVPPPSSGGHSQCAQTHSEHPYNVIVHGLAARACVEQRAQ